MPSPAFQHQAGAGEDAIEDDQGDGDGDGDDAFGEDFDEFEEGDVQEDFGDFDGGAEQHGFNEETVGVDSSNQYQSTPQPFPFVSLQFSYLARYNCTYPFNLKLALIGFGCSQSLITTIMTAQKICVLP